MDLAVGAASVASGGLDVGGRFWPTVSTTLMFSRRLGINADFLRRAGAYVNFRPWIVDGNLVFRPLQASWNPEVDLGIGFGQTFEFFIDEPTPFYAGPQAEVPYVVGPHLGLATTLYLSPHVFCRPVFGLYLFHPLGHPEYSDYAGLMVGYTFGGR